MRINKNLGLLLVLCSSLSLRAGTETEVYRYDAVGNATQIDDDQNRSTKFTFDGLDRLRTVTYRNGSVARMTLNPLDQVTQIEDPRGLITNFIVDPLQTRSLVTNPDTGRTVFTFSDLRKPMLVTDNGGRTKTSTYDAAGRIKTFIGSSAGPNITYHYDQGVNGKGHLTSMTDATGMSKWAYNNAGQVLIKEQNAGSINLVATYGYDQAGQRISIGYPSTNKVAYKIIAGQIREISLNGINLISAISYNSMGSIQGWTWASGVAYLRSFDLDGRLKSFPLGPNRRTLEYFPNGRIKSFTDVGSTTLYNQSFTYDSFDRLKTFTNSNGTQTFEYDNNGNPLKSGSFISSIESTSNRLTSMGTRKFSYNPVGTIASEVTDPMTYNYVYDSRNHLIGFHSTVKQLGKLGAASYMLAMRGATNKQMSKKMSVKEMPVTNASYQVNGISQRTSKTVSGFTTNFMYGDDGKLLGEYDSTGKMLQEIIYLGDMPIAAIRVKSTATLPTQIDAYNIYTDHLHVPRMITNVAGVIMWRWDFADPSGLSEPIQTEITRRMPFEFHLRGPGQYYDKETQTVHMRLRDYSPSLNRFLQPDPAGQYSSYSSYTYANSDLVNLTDAYGLAASADAKAEGASDSAFSRAISTLYNQVSWFLHAPGVIDVLMMGMAPEVQGPILVSKAIQYYNHGIDTKWVAAIGDKVYKCMKGGETQAKEMAEIITKMRAADPKLANIIPETKVFRKEVIVQQNVDKVGVTFEKLGKTEANVAREELSQFRDTASQALGGKDGFFLHKDEFYVIDRHLPNYRFNPCGTIACNFDPVVLLR